MKRDSSFEKKKEKEKSLRVLKRIMITQEFRPNDIDISILQQQ